MGAHPITRAVVSVGVIGEIVFLIAISPFGVGAAFPATPIMAAALFVTSRRFPDGHEVEARESQERL